MKNTLLHFLLVFVLFGCHFQTKAQGNLTFVGPVHYTCDFEAPYINTNGFQRVPIDTIVVPTGHVVKLESDNICKVSYNGPILLNSINQSIIGAIDLKISGISKATILSNMSYGNYSASRVQSFPMWLGPGVHYLYFSNNTQAQYLARYSLHGLLFQIQ
jgi:hypothetical protein